MFNKLFIFAVIIGCALATPVPEAKPAPEAKAAAKPNFVAPVVAPAVAYTAGYAAPLTYGSYLSPYAATYSAYSPYAAYSAPLVYV